MEKIARAEHPGGGGEDDSYIDKDGDGIYFLDPLVTGKYISKDTVDPINNSSHTYMYYIYQNYPGCPAGVRYVCIIALGLETGGGANDPGACITSWANDSKVYRIIYKIE